MQSLTLGGPGCHFSLVYLEGIIGKDKNQDDAKHLWEEEQGWHFKAFGATGLRERGGRWYGMRCKLDPRNWIFFVCWFLQYWGSSPGLACASQALNTELHPQHVASA